MKEGRNLQNVLLVSGMLGILVLAFIMDLIVQYLAVRNAELGNLDKVLVWLFPLMEFLWMLAVIGLVWLMISGGGYSRWISVIYLVPGLIVLYANPILYVGEVQSLYVVVQYLTPGTLLFQAGAALSAIGLLSLWFWKAPDRKTVNVDIEESEV